MASLHLGRHSQPRFDSGKIVRVLDIDGEPRLGHCLGPLMAATAVWVFIDRYLRRGCGMGPCIKEHQGGSRHCDEASSVHRLDSSMSCRPDRDRAAGGLYFTSVTVSLPFTR